jgi:hypothetical protein
VCCVLHHISPWCGSCLFSILESGFIPRASLYFTVNLIVSISLCSIPSYNLITNSKKFVIEYISVHI